jgi:hypothetical protein
MRKRAKFWIAVFVAVVFYVVVLAGGLTESTRRSIQVVDNTEAPDRVLVSIVVTNVNPAAQELTAQLGFRLAGSIAKDDVTPAVDLQLLANNVRGEQEFDFPKGKRMNRIEVVVPLNGELNKYPFDRYATTVWLLMTTPVRNAPRQAPKGLTTVPTGAESTAAPTATESPVSATPTGHGDGLAVSASALQRNTPVELSVSVQASITGIQFKGNVVRGSATDPTGAVLNLARAYSVIQVSLIVMAMMAALSLSLGDGRTGNDGAEDGPVAPFRLHFADLWVAGAPQYPAGSSAGGSARRLRCLRLGGINRCGICGDYRVDVVVTTAARIVVRAAVAGR